MKGNASLRAEFQWQRLKHRPWWKTGSVLMVAGLFVGFVLSWSGILLDWLFDIEEGSYVIFTMPLCALIGLGLFAAGVIVCLIKVIQRRRDR